jgi:CRP-like cAMP-binding protein
MISDSLLQGVYLFKELNVDERTSLSRVAQEMNLPAGFPIFRAGDPATALYLIKDGSVRIVVTAANGESIDVATLGSGSHFGEMALIDGAKRSASADMFRFDYDKITALLEGSPATAARLYRSMARFLSNRLRQTTTDMSFAREKNLRYF